MVGLDLQELRDRIADGPVICITIADHAGSSPRETGASIWVNETATYGTIGGGALEFDAIQTARQMLATHSDKRLIKTPLGPNLGQCCGGTVTLFFERHTHADITGDTFARATGTTEMPLSVRAHLRNIRSGATPNETRLLDGWFLEPIQLPRQPVWIYGAGHVGRALTTVLSALPFQITWIDVNRERFPAELPSHTDMLVAANPADAVRHAPDDAIHFVLTYSHAIDLEICQCVLNRPFKRLGLIGSNTKRTRFKRQLAGAGTDSSRLECPIGERSLGKEPMSIAIGVASDLIKQQSAAVIRNEEASA